MKLADYEMDAWFEYRAILDEFHASHNVKAYDRVSIHNAFPEIKAAFEKCLAMRTFRLLEND